MNTTLIKKSLAKLAYFGPADVVGTPVYHMPPYTVGQAMHDVRAYRSISDMQRRKALDDIVATKLDVNTPARRLFNTGIGAATGNILSRMVGANPFMQGMATAIGAQYGYNA